MEKCSKKNSPKPRVGLFNPAAAFLTTGLLFMASAHALGATDKSNIDRGPQVESVNQQGKTVTVIVSDASGELIGANVIVKGTTNGNVTDFNGQVVLDNVPANAILEISYIGYQTKEIPVGTNNHQVNLVEDSQALEEVVVVGYGTMEKKQVNQFCYFFWQPAT